MHKNKRRKVFADRTVESTTSDLNDRVDSIFFRDSVGVQCQKNTGFQIIPAPRSLSSTFEVEHFLNCELESESEASWYGLGLPIHRL